MGVRCAVCGRARKRLALVVAVPKGTVSAYQTTFVVLMVCNQQIVVVTSKYDWEAEP